MFFLLLYLTDFFSHNGFSLKSAALNHWNSEKMNVNPCSCEEKNNNNPSLASYIQQFYLTRADCFLRSEAGLRVVRGDALDGWQGDVGVCARQPRGLGLFGPALQVTRLQSISPAPPAAHNSASAGHRHFPRLITPLLQNKERNTKALGLYFCHIL